MARLIDVNTILLSCVALYLVAKTIRQYACRIRCIRLKGCLPAPSLAQLDPVFGLDLVFSQIFRAHRIQSRNRYLKELFATLGHTFQSRPYGHTELWTMSSQNIQSIYATHFESYGVGPLRHFVFEPLLGSGLMTTDGHAWKTSRAVINLLFSKAQVEEDLTNFESHISRLLDLIPNDGRTIDLQPLFDRLALDSSSDMLFGESVMTLSPERQSADAQLFLDSYNYAQRGVGQRMMLPFYNIFTRDPKFWASCRACHAFIDQIVQRAMQQNATQVKESLDPDNAKFNLASFLARNSNDQVQIREELLNLFLPAHDAIAIPLTNIFFNLARKPAIYSKLRQEILTLEDGKITYKVIKSLPYLQAVITETLRLFPGAGTNERVALKDTILPTGGGPEGTAPIYVCKGDTVHVNFYCLQRDINIWGEDAEEFKPERWEDLKPKPWTHLPFAAGPRVCPGSEQGLAMIKWTVVKMLQRFTTCENRDEVMEFEDLYRVVTVSKNGCKVGLRG